MCLPSKVFFPQIVPNDSLHHMDGTSFCQTEYSLHVLKYALKILNCVIQKAECKKHTSSFTITNQLKKSYQSVSD